MDTQPSTDYLPLPGSHADRCAGVLLGQALGDALGFLVEGRAPEQCAAFVERYLRSGDVREAQRGPFRFGQYSDDTQLARELALSLVAQGGFDASDYARRVAAIFVEGRIVGRGRATEAAALRIAAGVPWEQAGTPPPSAGNGSAMRAAPVGVFYADDVDQLVRVAHDQGRITHQDRRASAGAIAIALATAMALTAQAIDTAAFCAAIAPRVDPFDSVLADALRDLPVIVELPAGDAVTRLQRVGMAADYRDGWRGISPFVTPSVLWSLYAFLRHPDDVWEALATAIAVGGDVDTTAAMTGAIGGAFNGVSALPAALLGMLNDQGSWGFPDLLQLAVQLGESAERRT